MKPLLAVVGLTLKAAFRFRLIAALAVILLASVVALPMIIKDDGTARGLTQILLTYTLAITTGLLGIATLWVACGTLARDVDECQIQLVAVKPIPRWQIWLGKWLGIMVMNLLLLSLASAAIYGMLRWRASHLSEREQRILNQEVLVARASIKEATRDIEPAVEELFQMRLKEVAVGEMDREFVRTQIREQIKAQQQLVPSGYGRRWEIDLGWRKESLKDEILYIRFKFFGPPEERSTLGRHKEYFAIWEVGEPETPGRRRFEGKFVSETFHEIPIPENSFNDEGILTIDFINPNDSTLFFYQEDGLEVLFREGGFTLNFCRGVGIIYCWLGLLSAVGLAMASFLSFPVAAFVSMGILMITFSNGVMATVVQDGTFLGRDHESNTTLGPQWLDLIVVPIFSVLLKLVDTVQQFSPIDALSSGKSITWIEFFQAFGSIVLLMGGAFGLFGMIVFSLRELANPSSHQ